jgi:hypothetical protein
VSRFLIPAVKIGINYNVQVIPQRQARAKKRYVLVTPRTAIGLLRLQALLMAHQWVRGEPGKMEKSFIDILTAYK